MSLVILTLYEFHNSSSCISVDGEIKFAFNEDRFAKIKNEVGLPIKSAKKCIESLGIDPSEIDYVGIVNDEDSYKSYNSIVNYLFKRQSRYSIKDWIKENKEFWHPTIFKNKKLKSFFKVMGGKNKIAKDHYFKTDFYNENKNFNYLREIFFDIRRKSIKKILRIDEEKIKFIPHYICHHYHAYYSYSKERNMKKSIIIHAEGDGGKYNQGVSIPTKNGLKFINGTNKFNLGRLYQWVTLIMGMKPYHDEYKVMGLSPYSKEKYSYEIFLLLKKYFKLNKKNDSIEYSNNSPKDLYFTFQNILKDYRFDNIAGGLQLLLEVFISEWVSHIVTKYKRNQIYYAGGVAMNVKANLVISEIKKIKKFFVPISPADESNVFGANYYLMEKYFLKNKIDLSKIKPITSPYLGLTYAVPIKKIIQKKYKDIKIKKSSNLLVARKLLEGKIIGRFVERAEFGQRALGNRSIIASPFGEDIVKKINMTIKSRDFWMPFALSILDRFENKYLKKNIFNQSPYMTNCYRLLPGLENKLKNGIHPADNTVRPQIVTKKINYIDYDLINEFYKLTGVGAILNTSFNLHGETIVETNDDALYVFKNSNMDCLILGNLFLEKKS